eukprot:1143324-Pelagomonas_calceolata.AAC.1
MMKRSALRSASRFERASTDNGYRYNNNNEGQAHPNKRALIAWRLINRARCLAVGLISFSMYPRFIVPSKASTWCCSPFFLDILYVQKSEFTDKGKKEKRKVCASQKAACIKVF